MAFAAPSFFKEDTYYMSNKINIKKTNMRKLIFKSQYTSEDLIETKEQFSKFKEQFYKDFPEEYNRMLEAAAKKQKGIDPTNEEEEKEEVIKSADAKKLYRRISKITHPDKVESEVLTEYFSKASTAYGENDISSLYVIASSLNIDVSDMDSEYISQELERSTKEAEQKSQNMKGSLAWEWAMAETDEQKEVIKEIIKKHVEDNY